MNLRNYLPHFDSTARSGQCITTVDLINAGSKAYIPFKVFQILGSKRWSLALIKVGPPTGLERTEDNGTHPN